MNGSRDASRHSFKEERENFLLANNDVNRSRSSNNSQVRQIHKDLPLKMVGGIARRDESFSSRGSGNSNY